MSNSDNEKGPNVLITDYHSASNRGDAAILEGELSSLRDRLPNAEFTILTEYPDAAEMMHGVEAERQRIAPFKFGNLRKNIKTSVILADAIFSSSSGRSGTPLTIHNSWLNYDVYSDADLVISTGGQFLTDIYFPDKIAVLLELYLCKCLGKTVVVYAQSLGPFEKRGYAALTKRILNMVDLVITRDEKSVEHLSELGVDEPPIRAQSDAAFTMSLQKETDQAEIWCPVPQLENSEGPIISISVRNWDHFNSKDGKNKYVESVAKAADSLINEYDATIVFASTCTGLAGYHTDDRVAAQKIINDMSEADKRSPMILSGEHTPQQLVSFYENIDIHIGTRMHSNILALMAHTPIVPIKYQFKTEEIVEKFDISELLIDIESIDSKLLFETTKQVIENKDIYENRIRENLADAIAKSERSADYVAQTFNHDFN